METKVSPNLPATTVDSLWKRWAWWCCAWLGETARTSGLALIDQIVVSATRFATTVLIGRMAPEAELGIYSLGFSIVLIVVCVQDSLIAAPYTVYMNRLAGADRARYAGGILLQLGLISLLAVVGLLLSSLANELGIGPAGLWPVLAMLAGVMPWMLLREFGRRYAFAHLQVTAAIALDVVMAVVQLGGIFLLAASGTLSAITAYAVVGLAAAVAGGGWLATTRRHFQICWRDLPQEIARNWSFSRWVFGSQLTSVMHSYFMHWLLALMLGTVSTAHFAACATVVLLANPLILSVNNMVSPRAARAFVAGGHAAMQPVIAKATIGLGLAMAAFCAVIALAGGDIVAVLFKRPEYANYGAVITVLALGTLVGTITVGISGGLWAMERPDVNFKSALVGLIVTAILSSWMIARWQLLGAALGLLAGNAAMSAFQTLAFWRLSRAALRAEGVA